MTGRNKSLDANEKGCPDKSLHEFPWGAHVADPIPTQKPGMEGTGTYRPDVPGPTPGSLLYGYVSEARWQAIRTKEIYPFWVDLSKEQRMLWEREAKLICCAMGRNRHESKTA